MVKGTKPADYFGDRLGNLILTAGSHETPDRLIADGVTSRSLKVGRHAEGSRAPGVDASTPEDRAKSAQHFVITEAEVLAHHTGETARIERQLANLRELYIAADITREEYVGRKRAMEASLQGGRAQPTYSEATLVRAARLLSELGVLWAKAMPEERAEIASGLFSELRVKDSTIVGARLATDEYLPLIASATARSVVVLARPEVSESRT